MALPEEGDLLLSDAATEYGLSGDINLSDFYGLLNLPTGGDLKLSDFYGKRDETLTEMLPRFVEISTVPGETEDYYGFASIHPLTPPPLGSLSQTIFTTASGIEFEIEQIVWTTREPGFADSGTTAFGLRLLPTNVSEILDLLAFMEQRSRTLTILDEFVEVLSPATGTWGTEGFFSIKFFGNRKGSNPVEPLLNQLQIVSVQDIIDT